MYCSSGFKTSSVFQDAAADSWWSKTPQEKKRQRVMQRLEEMAQEAEERAAANK